MFTEQPDREDTLRVAVVGSGPSGFYAAEALLKSDAPRYRVDMFDRLPTPFGLVRGGVAPDHQKIKSVIKAYERIAESDRFRFFGNVLLGRDISADELSARYHQVVLATGNESDRRLGIAGEDLEGVYSATEFVGWYNGHPDFRNREFALSGARNVVVVGNGNVAMDVVRILAQNPDRLADTDITDYALESLRESTIDKLTILGRRGPAQSVFSPGEIKELGSLESATLTLDPGALELGDVTKAWLENDAPRDAIKNLDYLRSVAESETEPKPRTVSCRFLISPVELLGEDGRLTAVRCERNELYARSNGEPRPRGTGEFEDIPADLVFKAIGYRGVPIPGVPFHERWGIIPNALGRITESHEGPVRQGWYVVGWAKRGPTGLIGTNRADAKETVALMLEDADNGLALEPIADETEALLKSRNVRLVTFADWQLIDAEEISRGAATGKVREKFSIIADMLTLLG
ncbi:MAG: FAD-dependent oxidoreductase [Myxococcales bacterium]|nr:FAD-dependent oxidoreductase [Myxococcales bacterium]